MDSNTPYNASITRRPYMFYEMRKTAELVCQGLSEDVIINKIVNENLYQYPTERSLRDRATCCLQRLRHLDDDMVRWIVERPLDVAKQLCLYAFMKDSRLVYEFMIIVIGEKYKTLNFSYSRSDITKYMNCLQEQSGQVAGWSDATIKKLSSVLGNILKEAGYIETPRSKKLNEVVIDYKLKDKLIEKGEEEILSAFNCFI